MNKPLEIKGSILAHNTLFNLIGQGLPLVVAVATIPFIIQGMGIERFGLLSLAWVVLGYFAIFYLGLGRATTKFVVEALGKDEEEQVPIPDTFY
jgi:O-antigen/teichoic acid export membrane protein